MRSGKIGNAIGLHFLLMAVTFARPLQVAVRPAIPLQSGCIAVFLFNLLDKPIYFRNRFIGQFVVDVIQFLNIDENGMLDIYMGNVIIFQRRMRFAPISSTGSYKSNSTIIEGSVLGAG